MDLFLFVLATFLLSAMLGWMTIPHIVLVSKKKRLFDEISDRKSHTGSVPRLGGISFFPAFLISLYFMIGLRYFYGYEISPYVETTVFMELAFFVTGSTVLFFVGMADDLTGMSYRIKLVAQIIAAIMVIYAGVGIVDLGGLFGIHAVHPLIGSVLTIILVVLIINSYNLIDGIDGLCSSLSLIALFTFCWWFSSVGLYFYAMLSMAMAGVVSTFFFYNIMGKRLKVFMGDTGSLALGYLIAFLGLKFYTLNMSQSEIYTFVNPATAFIGVIFVPVFDAVRVFCVRIMSGLSPFYPDKRHIHHKMLKLGMTHLQSMLIIVIMQAFFIGFNVVFNEINITLLVSINIAMGLLFNQIINWVNKYKENEKELLSAVSKIRANRE